jgi:phage repressor protein C with HTH and peptisase S24 domain
MPSYNYAETQKAVHQETIRVPTSLNPGQNSYALTASGMCLAPIYGSGDVLICDPDQPPLPGDFVSVWWKDGKRQPSAKRLVLALPPKEMTSLKQIEFQLLLVCEQLNPPKQLVAQWDDIEAVHKIIGKVPNTCAKAE